MITTTAPDNHHQATDDDGPLCDFCTKSKAVLYCRADSAKLCFTCDREVHSTNPLFKKHTRCLLCNSCNSSPASIFCCTESVVLCQNCDWETHNNFKVVHDRRPVEGFYGCPSVGELVSVLGFEDLGKIKNDSTTNNNNKNKEWLNFGGEEDEEFEGLRVWETPSVVSLDDLVVPNDNHNWKVMGLPPLPKNRNAVCGKHKEEILCQLREMAKDDPNFSGSLEDFEPNDGFQLQVPGKHELTETSPGIPNKSEPLSLYETGAQQWCDYSGGFPDQGLSPTFFDSLIDLNHIVPDKDSDAADGSGTANGPQEALPSNHVDLKNVPVIPTAVVRELNSQERDSALSRYKEKKKTRRYDKHIRYESRKVRAETRTRIKGRFAKIDR